jgi:predicted RNA-binding protein with PUA-like domain
MVDFKYKFTLPSKVTLKEIKENEKLQNLALIKQSRLSVMPVAHDEWQEILNMGNYYE